ncbi:MAG: DUF805 domain-containing protein [Oscillospiraceae bacterium]|nr:DUF805 domain-containing protein [Oscillospiraceae bacterium]
MRYNKTENFNLISGYASIFKKYAQFSGRSRRSEFWFAVLAHSIITLPVASIAYILTGVDMARYGETTAATGIIVLIVEILLLIYYSAVFIPFLAVMARRLHDTGKSGWWILLHLIPVGQIILFIFFLLDSQPGSNKYGPNPKGI